jgi:hypothetical protein
MCLATGSRGSRTRFTAKRPGHLGTGERDRRSFLSRKRRENLMQRLTGTTRTAEAFRKFNRYRILRLVAGTG